MVTPLSLLCINFHRYGASAAEASKHVMNAGGHAANAWWMARRIGVKAIAKSTAKSTAKAAFSNLIHSGTK